MSCSPPSGIGSLPDHVKGVHAMASAQLETLLPAYRSALVARGHRPRGIDRYLDQLRAFTTYLGPDATMEQLTTATITAARRRS